MDATDRTRNTDIHPNQTEIHWEMADQLTFGEWMDILPKDSQVPKEWRVPNDTRNLD